MTDLKSQIFIIDDEPEYLELMKESLDREFDVSTFEEPSDALKQLLTTVPDAVLLDIQFKYGQSDGFQIFKEIKTLHPDIPVFFLSNNTATEVIGKGLLSGGVDYFSKSMPLKEINVRLKARLETLKQNTILRCRDIEMDLQAMEVRIKGKLISLTPKEYDILKVFMERQDQILSKHQLKDLLWKDIHVDVNNIDTHMFHIRKKFGEKSGFIDCRKGVGYILHSRPSKS